MRQYCANQMTTIVYSRLLSKMLMIEKTGEILYRELSLKSRDINSKDLYERLADNEQRTASYIKEELVHFNIKESSLVRSLFVAIASLFFRLLTIGQLKWILKKVLKRRVYSSWFDRNKDSNQQFWQKLLEHEKIQFKLLNLQ